MSNEENKDASAVNEVEKVKKETSVKVQFRCPKATADEFNALSLEMGEGNAGCFQNMLNSVKLDNRKSKNVDLEGDINSLISHINSIQSIFLGIIDKTECQKADIAKNGVNNNKIYNDKIIDLDNQIILLKLAGTEHEKILAEKVSLCNTLNEKYNTTIETLNDKINIASSIDEKNKSLETENLELKENAPELTTCKENLKIANNKILEQQDTMTKNFEKINKLEIEKSDLTAKNIAEIALLKQKLNLDLKGGLLEQREIQQNRFDGKLLLHQKLYEEKQNMSDEKYRVEIDSLYKHQGTLYEQIKAAGKEKDEIKSEYIALKHSNGKEPEIIPIVPVDDENKVDVLNKISEKDKVIGNDEVVKNPEAVKNELFNGMPEVIKKDPISEMFKNLEQSEVIKN